MVGGKENALLLAPALGATLRLGPQGHQLFGLQTTWRGGASGILCTRLKGEAARPCGPRGRGGDCQPTPWCPRSWVVSCPRACSLPVRHPGSTGKSEPGVWGAPTACQAAGALPSCGEGGLLPPWEGETGSARSPCWPLPKKPRPDATSASQVPLLPAEAFGCLLIALGLRPPPHQVRDTWLPVSSLSSEALPTAEPPKDGHSPRSSCGDQGQSRQARLPNGACWAVSWRGL